ncbi:MAG: hypothetical protein DWI01_07045, partial [Planctomycetota bacterium]
AESCLPPGEPGPRSDQYALAVLWAHARTGRPPFREGEKREIVRAKLASAPPLDDLPGGERAVVSRALSSSADQRYASCAEFAAALAAAVEPTPAASPSPQPPSAAPQTGESFSRSVVSDAPPELEAPPSPRPSEPTPAAVIETNPDRFDQTKLPMRVAEPVAVAAAAPSTSDSPATDVSLPTMADPAVAVTATVAPGNGASGVPLAAYPYKKDDVIVPGYRLVKTLGKGGFGEVWQAKYNGQVSHAIKVIPHLGREGVKEYRAIQTVKDIRHSNIVVIVGVWLKGPNGHLLDEAETRRVGEWLCTPNRAGTSATFDLGGVPAPDQLELVIAMTLGEQTLAQRLEQHKASLGPGYEGLRGIEPKQLLEWMKQAAMAIDHFNRGAKRGGASGADVQHCDIKPQNMLLVGNTVQVCDFGLARIQQDVRTTTSNHLSLAYAAPEMMSKPHQPSPATDQYSLAVTYHELRTGLLPYAGQTGRNPEELLIVAILEAKRAGDLDLSLVGPAERSVLEKAMSVVPAERFGSCEAMIHALGIALEQDGRTPPAGAAEAKGARRKTSPTKLLGLVGLAAGGTVVAGLVGFLLFSSAAGGVRRQIEQARTLIDEAVADEGGLKVDTLDAAEKLLEKVDRRKHPEAATLLDSLAVAREVIGLDDEAGLEKIETARRKVDDARSNFPGTLAQALDRQLTERRESAEAAREASEIAAAVTALEANPEPSAAAIDTLEERIKSGTSLEASAQKSFQTRIGAVRERQVEKIVSEARKALVAAVPDGEAPIDRAALEAVDATAASAGAYQPADTSPVEKLRRAVRAVLEMDRSLRDPSGTLEERAARLKPVVEKVGRDIPSDLVSVLWDKTDMTKKELAFVLNACAFGLARSSGVDERAGEHAVRLAEHAVKQVSDVALLIEYRDTLALAMSKAGQFSKAIETLDLALSDAASLREKLDGEPKSIEAVDGQIRLMKNRRRLFQRAVDDGNHDAWDK